MVGVIVVPVGLAIGLPAGYFGGVVDTVLMRITDIFLAFPRLVLALAFAAALGPGIENAVIAIALTAWPPYARLARAETLTSRRAEFIQAAELQGASHLRIIATQIVPLCLPSVIIRLTLDMAGIILTAAGLGFLGLGAQPPAPEWGAMVSSGRQVLLDQWWVATIPGLAIFIVSLGFNLLGDGLARRRATRRSMTDTAARRAQPQRHLFRRRRRCPRRAQRQLHAGPRAPGHRRRKRLGQIHDRARHHGPCRPVAAASRRTNCGWATPICAACPNAAFASCAASASPWCCRTRNTRSIR